MTRAVVFLPHIVDLCHAAQEHDTDHADLNGSHGYPEVIAPLRRTL